MNSPPAHWPPPVDLYGLGLLRLVALHGSITRAAVAAGLTQSALTRQIQGMEQRLGTLLFDRTTRSLRLTPAGESLLRHTAPVGRIMDEALSRLGLDFLNVPREVRLGVSNSIAFAHLPGLLHAHLRRSPGVKTTVEHLAGLQVVSRIESGDLDVGVLCPPGRLPASVSVTHSMEDVFQLIAPAALQVPEFVLRSRNWTARLAGWLNSQSWLLHHGRSRTGQLLRRWLRDHGVSAHAAMEPDNFDLSIHLAALGLGVSLVPRRALAGFPRKQQIRRIRLPEEFTRTLAVVVPSVTGTPPHVSEFVKNILFS